MTSTASKGVLEVTLSSREEYRFPLISSTRMTSPPSIAHDCDGRKKKKGDEID